jgi:hypothetical protein
MRVFRRMSIALVAAASMLPLLFAAPAQGSPGAAPATPSAVTSDDTYRFVGDFGPAHNLCQRYGQAGVDRGDWLAYQCRPRLTGLGTFWSLYVTP